MTNWAYFGESSKPEVRLGWAASSKGARAPGREGETRAARAQTAPASPTNRGRFEIAATHVPGGIPCASPASRRRNFLPAVALTYMAPRARLRTCTACTETAGPYAVVSKSLNPGGGKASMSSAVLAGSSAGVCYWSVVYPLAVVKVAFPSPSPLQTWLPLGGFESWPQATRQTRRAASERLKG